MRALRFVASYSSTPKPRRGHRRVSGGGSVSGAEPLLVGVTTPPVVASGTSSAVGASVERERLEWMRQQRPPHWGNNIV